MGPRPYAPVARPRPWFHWDTFNYLSIAQTGTTFGRCGSPGFPTSALERYAHVKWCGNAGWLPGFPLLVKLVTFSGLAPDTAGMIIAGLCTATAIFLIWFGWCHDLPAWRSLVVLVLFGVFPGAMYNFAIFPTSAALAAVVGAIVVASRAAPPRVGHPDDGRRALLSLRLVRRHRTHRRSRTLALPEGRNRVARHAAWGLAGLSSLVVLALYDTMSVDVSDTFFVFQQSNVGGAPIATLLDLLVTGATSQQHLLGRFGARVLSVQVIVALAVTGTSAVIAGKAYRRHDEDGATTIAACVGVAVVLGMLLSQNVGAWNRSVVLAAPCVVGLRRLPLPVLLPITIVTTVTTTLLSRYSSRAPWPRAASGLPVPDGWRGRAHSRGTSPRPR